MAASITRCASPCAPRTAMCGRFALGRQPSRRFSYGRAPSTEGIEGPLARPHIHSSDFSRDATYGLIVADNGSDMFISGAMDPRWKNGELNPAFRRLTADDFDVIQLGWR